jgi:hypothetical protein
MKHSNNKIFNVLNKSLPLALAILVLGASIAVASLTISGSSITGDSSFTGLTSATSTTIDVGSGNTLYLQTTNNGPINTGTGTTTIGSNLVVSGAMKNTATKIVAASNTPNKTARADYIGDGVNDQVAIKAAIDSLSGTGGRVILLEGTYYINSEIQLSDTANNDNVTLEGQGMSTILKVPNGNSSVMDIIDVVGNSRAIYGVTIKNLQIDGNGPNVTGTWYAGIKFSNVASSTIDGVFLSNAKSSTGDGYGYLIMNSTDITIHNCTGENWYFEPMEIRGSNRVLVTGSTFENRIELYDTSNYVTFTNNTFINM